MTDTVIHRKDWAVFVYMCADVPQPEIHQASHTNLLQMAKVGSNNDVWLAAQLDIPGPWTFRYVFPERPPGSQATIIKPVYALPNVNSASPNSIENFFSWAAATCPAKNIMLVLWGHGYGIDYYDPAPPSGLDFFGKFAALRSLVTASSAAIGADFRASSPIVGIDPQLLRFGWDASANSFIDNHELGEALRACVKRLPDGQNLAILGFDACVMAMAEVWCEMTGSASIGIASEASLPYLSWPYDGFLARLLKRPNAEPVDVAKMLVGAFTDFYATHPTKYVNLSAIDLTKVDQLEAAITPLADALEKASIDPQARQNIFTARDYCPIYDKQGFIDLGCFCEFLKITMPDTPVSKACGPARDAIKQFVIDSRYSPPNPNKKIAQSTGVSVWLPPWIQDPEAYAIEKDLAEAYLTNGYPKTQFALTTSWDRFLANFRFQAWGEASKSENRTALQLARADTKCRVRNGGNSMSHEDMGDRDMGDRDMGDRDMGDRDMGDRDMGDRDMGDRDMGDRDMGDRDMGAGGKNAQRVFSTVSSGAAGVVLRATVESFGPAGDGELSFNVKWPAATFAAASAESLSAGNGKRPARRTAASPHSSDGSLEAPATQPPPPHGNEANQHKPEAVTGE